MRAHLPALLLLLACSGQHSTFEPPPPPPAPDLIGLEGEVRDSLTGAPVADAAIFGGDSTAITGIDGRYHLLVPSGSVTLRITASGYEHGATVVDVLAPRQINLRLRRLAPALVACALRSDTLFGVVVDLQGRKTIDRRDGSFALFTMGSTHVSGDGWYWQAVDYLTWRIAVPLSGAAGDDAQLILRDTEGWIASRTCAGLPSPLEDPQGPLALRGR